jgi:ribosome-binding factor A
MHVSKPYRRRDRVGPMVHRKLNAMLAKNAMGLDFGAMHMTIVSVDVSPDFAQAKVYFALLDQDSAEEVTKRLNGMAKVFQGELARDLPIRRAPRLIFVFDETLVTAGRIDALLADA